MKYQVHYGLDEVVTFDKLEQATIFTLGLTAKGECFTLISA